MSFSMCIVRGAVTSILAGESFTIPTDGAKKSLIGVALALIRVITINLLRVSYRCIRH